MDDPELYASSHSIQLKSAKNFVDRFGPHLARGTEDDLVLDVGCGSGEVTCKCFVPALGPFRQLFATDINLKMVEFARQNNPHSKVTYEVLDIEDVSEFLTRRGPFAKILSSYCLHWAQDLTKTFQNIRSLLDAGGQAFLCWVTSSPIFDAFDHVAKDPRWKCYMQDLEEVIGKTRLSKDASKAVAQLATEVGLEVISSRSLDLHESYSTAEDLLKSTSAVNPFLQRFPEECKAEYNQDVLNSMINFNDPQYDRLSLQVTLVVLHARKPHK